MRYNFLVASWGAPGHLGPMLVAAQQLRSNRHGVRFISRSDSRAAVEAAGFGIVTWQRTPCFSPIAPNSADERQAYDNLIFGPAAARAADTRDEIDRASTDAVLTDAALIGAALAAEAACLPCALLSTTISLRPLPGVPPLCSQMRPPRTLLERREVEAASRRFAAVMNEWLPMLNQARTSQTLAPADHVLDIFDRPERHLLATSAAFDFPADALPGNVRYIGPLLDTSDWCAPWARPWPEEPDRPRALVSFSTTNQEQTDVLQRVMNAVAHVEMDAIVTVGPGLDVETLHAPKHVTLLASAPHDAVMKDVSLVVTHGGHGTVTRALRHGLPLLVMPMGRDQGDIAVRVEARGAGLTLPPAACETHIVAALSRLINEPRFALAARGLGEAIAADIKSGRLVAEMEEIAGLGINTAASRSARRSLGQYGF
jgi:UDP:flavonoid glycosyltransferase YjiC (YdhE family)